MSEGFDKEAEREKLREKYGEEEDREATRQMSELLLKGATMTNRHCDSCGDPVFRYDGQEFCPTCQGADGAGTGTDAGAGGETAAESDAATDDGSPRSTTDSGTPQSTTDGESAAPTRSEAGDEPTRRETRGRPEPAGRTPTERPATPAPTEGGSGGEREGERGRDSRASLERTLTRFARAAEASEDPRAAREHLAAAREAAEALAALRR